MCGLQHGSSDSYNVTGITGNDESVEYSFNVVAGRGGANFLFQGLVV